MLGRIVLSGTICALFAVCVAIASTDVPGSNGDSAVPTSHNGMWRVPENGDAHCLEILVRSSGIAVRSSEVRAALGTDRTWHTAQDLIRAGKSLGATIDIRSLTPDELRGLNVPVIVAMEGGYQKGYFAVAWRASRDDEEARWLVLSGGEIGLEFYDDDRFRRSWTGVAMFVKPREASVFGVSTFAIFSMIGYLALRLGPRLWSASRRQRFRSRTAQTLAMILTVFGSSGLLWSCNSAVAQEESTTEKKMTPQDLSQIMAALQSKLLPLDITWTETTTVVDSTHLNLAKKGLAIPGRVRYRLKTDGTAVYESSVPLGDNAESEFSVEQVVRDGVYTKGSREAGVPFSTTIVDVADLVRKKPLGAQHKIFYGSFLSAAGVFEPVTCDDFLSSKGVRYSVQNALENMRSFSDLGMKELAGSRYHVIEIRDQEETTYLYGFDFDRGGILGAFEERTDGGALEVQYLCQDFRSFGDSQLTLPTVCIANHYSWGALVPPQKGVAVRIEYRLEQCHQGPLSESDLSVDYSSFPDVRVLDQASAAAKRAPNGRLEYKIPRNPEMLEATINESVRQAIANQSMRQIPGRRATHWTIVGINVIGFILVLAFVFWKKRLARQ